MNTAFDGAGARIRLLPDAVGHALRDSMPASPILRTSGAVLLGSALVAFPPSSVHAQDEDSALEEITVTGSRIRRQDFTANSPITTVDESTFEETSTIGVETILNQLPQFVPAVTQFTTTDVQNSVTNTVGASTVSLRGLGPNRNLVLIDGRRGQPANAALVVDTNAIPSAAIQRVEVISGGASAVYGADAVGGVVNFILKDDFEGATIDARYGVTQESDNEEMTISGLIGANVADGRGNVMLGIEHSRRSKVLDIARDWRVDELNNPNILGNEFWFAETYFTQSDFGNNPSQEAVDELYADVEGYEPGMIAPSSSWFINPTPDGTGTVFTGVGTFVGGGIGGQRYDGPVYLQDHSQFGTVPGVQWRKEHPDGSWSENALTTWASTPLDRYSAFAKADFDLSDTVTLNAQAMFTRTRTETNLSFTGAALGANSATIPHGDEIYEPSLAEDGVSTLPAYQAGGAYGLNCPTMGGCTESQAFPKPPELEALLATRPNENGDVQINRPLDFLGPRATQPTTDTFQLVMGLEGEAFDDDFWDIHMSHGQTANFTNFTGYAARERWRAIAGSPNYGVAFSQIGNEQGGGFAGGFANCTTGLPLVREFAASEDCIQAITASLQNNQEVEQNILEANLTGGLADMPAGALQYAVGATYRDAAAAFRVDNLQRNESFTENVLGLFPAANTDGEFDVRELYGELLIPLVSDQPGADHLNLELGGRSSDYSSVGSVDTYKALLDWAIVPRVRVRGGVNLANRAPNLGELFQARTQVFGGSGAIYGDQCRQGGDNAGPFSADPEANVDGAEGAARTLELCREMMGEAAAEQYYMDSPDDQGAGLGLPNTTGNPNLTSEEADTLTLGLVVDFLDNWTMTVDYYEIEITDMIAVESGDQVSERCLSPEFNPEADPNASACQSIIREPTTGNVSQLDLSYTNLGRALTAGVDLQLNYSTMFTNGGGFNMNLLANYNMENITQAEPGQDEIDWAGTSGCALQLQCMGYDYRVFTTFNYFQGPWSASLRWQHWPSIKAGSAATDPATDAVGVPSSYNLFALTGNYRFRDRYTLRFGIENLFDEIPPLSGGDPDNTRFPMPMTRSQSGGTYDQLGRRGFVNLTMDF